MKKILIIFLLLIILAPSCPKRTPEFYYQEGNKLEKVKDFTDAIKYYSSTIKQNPSFLLAYESRAKCNMAIDSITNAMRDYDTLIVKILNSNDYQKLGDIYFLKADAYYLLSQDSLACKYYRKAGNLNNLKSRDRLRKRCK